MQVRLKADYLRVPIQILVSMKHLTVLVWSYTNIQAVTHGSKRLPVFRLIILLMKPKANFYMGCCILASRVKVYRSGIEDRIRL